MTTLPTARADVDRSRVTLATVAVVATVSVIVQLVDEGVALTPDSESFMNAASGILDGNPVDARRTPGYPLLLALAGTNSTVAGILQAILFVGCAVGVGFLTQRATGRWWAGATGAVFGLMEFPLDFTRTITSELMAMTLLVGVACLGAVFRPKLIWPSAAVVCLLVFTRPEFLALPAVLLVLVLFGYRERRTRIQAALAAASIYGLVALYVVGNQAINGYTGLTEITRVNLLGKVIQYDMQDEAPVRYSTLTARIQQHLEAGHVGNPYDLAEIYPSISADHWKLAGDYGRSVVEAAPEEYAWKTVRFAARQTKGLVLAALGLLAWALVRTPGTRVVAFLSLLCVYDIALTSLGAYDNFERLYSPIFPLLIVLMVSIVVIDVELLRRTFAGRLKGHTVESG